MRKKLLCMLAAAALLLGVLAGCGGGTSGSSDPSTPGVGSTEPDKSGHTDDGPLAVMQERVNAVNEIVNYQAIGLEEKVEEGLLFYDLTRASSASDEGEPQDYNPDKPLDYYVWYRMIKEHTEGVVSEDTYAALLKDARPWGMPITEFSAEDVIETDDLYAYCEPAVQRGNYSRSRCLILVKGTDILYCFSVEEQWYMANYYGNGNYNFPNSDSATAQEPGSLDLAYNSGDVEYIFTDEFWKAFAQSAKFVGNADESFEDDEYINGTISSIGRNSKVKVPYIEEWYAGGAYGRDTIHDSFEKFFEEYEVYLTLEDGTEKKYPATVDYGIITVDLGNGQTVLYEDLGNGELALGKASDMEIEKSLPQTARGSYVHGGYGFLVIDDFGRGEPTMFYNSALYKYAGGGEVTLIHDFADTFAGLSEDWWMSMSTDPDRTHLLFSSGAPDGDEIRVVDLKTFEITDEVWVAYDMDTDEFTQGTVNGVDVDGETAWAKCNEWYSTCNVWLLGRGNVEEIDFGAAWSAYNNRG